MEGKKLRKDLKRDSPSQASSIVHDTCVSKKKRGGQKSLFGFHTMAMHFLPRRLRPRHNKPWNWRKRTVSATHRFFIRARFSWQIVYWINLPNTYVPQCVCDLLISTLAERIRSHACKQTSSLHLWGIGSCIQVPTGSLEKIFDLFPKYAILT